MLNNSKIDELIVSKHKLMEVANDEQIKGSFPDLVESCFLRLQHIDENIMRLRGKSKEYFVFDGKDQNKRSKARA